MRQLSLCSTTTEPALCSPEAATTEPFSLDRVLHRETTTVRSRRTVTEESLPLLTTRESSQAAMKTRRSQKINKKIWLPVGKGEGRDKLGIWD